jgi:hypothetical protein
MPGIAARLSAERFIIPHGISLLLYPVEDVARAKAVYGKLLGVQLYMDEPYYVGFRVGDQEIGLDPSGRHKGMTGPVAVGGGKLTAAAKDAGGNIIGLLQMGE